MNTSCTRCGSTTRRKQRFCSQSCYHAHKKEINHVVRLCPTCGGQITARTSYDAKRRKFCSMKCKRHTDDTKERIRQKKAGVPVHSEKTKRMFRERMLGNQWAMGHRLTPKHKQKLIKSGGDHWGWKDKRVGYSGLHKWVNKYLGHPDTCEHCGKSGLSGHDIHWANKSGEYKRDLTDWLRLCSVCHGKYDSTQ